MGQARLAEPAPKGIEADREQASVVEACWMSILRL
jgi:hypothetical protein